MPSEKKQALGRQWELLKLLPRKGTGKSARMLAQELSELGFSISKRQVERDLLELSEHFAILCNDKSIPYGWSWLPGSGGELHGLTLAEALSLKMAESSIRALLPPAYLEAVFPRLEEAERKLAGLAASNPASDWRNKIRSVQPTQPLFSPILKPGILETVQDALLNNRQLAVSYRSFQAESAQRYDLHPLGLVLRGVSSYLIALKEAEGSAHMFALHRLESATMGDAPSKRPLNFDLDGYLDSGAMHFGAGHLLMLEAELAPELAGMLQETPLSEDQALSQIKRGQWLLTATVRDSWQLIWWILSQGDAIQVQAPLDLRERIKHQLEATLRLYR